MIIGTRLRQLRQQKELSQGDIEERTGLPRSYISRVENNYTQPSIEKLELFAAGLELPLYQLFYQNGENGHEQGSAATKSLEELAKEEGEDGSEARFLLKLRTLIDPLGDSDRHVLLVLARRLASRKDNDRVAA